MAQNTTRSNVFKRGLAALALVVVYSVSFIGSSFVVATATSTSADARGRGGGGRGGGGRGRGGGFGRGRGGGWARGRGRGFGYGFIAPGCYWSPRWGRTICPY